MSAEHDRFRDTFAEELASFDSRLGAANDDVEAMADIRKGIQGLLAANRSNEAEIRRVLEERYKAGTLKQATHQLVNSMLDQRDSGEPASDDAFGSTTVIPNDIVPFATADSRVQVGSLLRDRFLLQEKVSGGSMGVVYKALDRRLAEAEADQPWVAVKVLSPQLAENGQALRALQQEAAKGRCLVHPNIVRFIDLDRDDDLYFLVMEWLEGRTLANILDSTDAKSIDHDAAFRIVGEIGDALDYAHRCGIVHADVKPANIMIMPDGEAKLFDFGVARVRQKQTESEFDPGVLGALTPAYSSMQVLTGDDPVPSDDVYALGCLLYRLIAGHRVFGPRNAAEASQEGMNPQRPQGLGDGQWRALKKALSYARVTRFASVHEFTDALRDYGDDTTSFDTHERVEDVKKGAGGTWMAVLVLILAMTGGGLYLSGNLDPWLTRIGDSLTVGDVETQDDVQAPPVADLENLADEVVADTDPIAEGGESPDEPDIVDSAAVVEPLVDFSTMPPADVEVSFKMGTVSTTDFRAVLREDGRPVIVDFVRNGGLGLPLALKLEEVGFSGNRSPWSSRQYSLSNAGFVRFPVGQERARTTLSMASDRLREADQLSTLRLREVDSAASELAVLYVTLEDDDQRAFEARLPANTIAFAASQTSIRESDPAVQIDLVRFNPDGSRVVADYTINDVTATEGEDYFAPGRNSVTFGPGQRSARLLIPLVQDALYEGDEAFVIRLSNSSDPAIEDVFQRVVVMIRDDEAQIR